jgi:hypothetical protein
MCIFDNVILIFTENAMIVMMMPQLPREEP